MAKRDKKPPVAPGTSDQLEPFRRDNTNQKMTSDTGVRIQHTDDSLKAGVRGPTLLEDFHLREKITRFDHERIPERVVHARGSGAHGFFQVYQSQAKWTKAGFLQDPAARTRVFVRFSTVVGSRGAADTARDVRGLSPPEQQHLIDAAKFELGKVETKAVRERVVANFALVDAGLAEQVAAGIGVTVKAGATKGEVKPGKSVRVSPALSMANSVKSPKGRCVAFLIEDGFQKSDLDQMKSALKAAGATFKLISSKLGAVQSAEGKSVEADQTFLTASSVFFDAVYVPGGDGSAAKLTASGDAIHFVNEAFRHCKTVAATGEGRGLIESSDIPDLDAPGVITAPKAGAAAQAFIDAIAQHRHGARNDKAVPA